MDPIASQITSLTIVYSTVYSGTDQSKHQSSASPAFVWGIHRGPVNSPHKWPVTRKMFPFDDVIMSQDLTETILGCYSPPPGSVKSLTLSFYTIDDLPGNLWNYKSKRLNFWTHWTNITPSLHTKHLTALDANDEFWNLFLLDAITNTHNLN